MLNLSGGPAVLHSFWDGVENLLTLLMNKLGHLAVLWFCARPHLHIIPLFGLNAI